MLPKTSLIVVGVFVLLTVIYFCAVGCAVPGQTPPGLLTSCSTSPSQWRRTGRNRTESWNLSWYTLNSVNSRTLSTVKTVHILVQKCAHPQTGIYALSIKIWTLKECPMAEKYRFHNIVKSVKYFATKRVLLSTESHQMKSAGNRKILVCVWSAPWSVV